MRCKGDCGRYSGSNANKYICWTRYQMCRYCCAKTHPEIYLEGKRLSMIRTKQKLLKEKLS